ncbi:Meiosis protein mei2 [Neolecta irregularis DAH-3]|uniref:Meiosis protein mei2 n=1 Tax=Neolecta irregularis (strain DAH-3) TaxID=1198029 RepID=A0A1U7LKW3_NEOID|nr:Meiosis protein mei2 [Neolecta irregularis DAH-3]|eukprot:OLL23278.1 Meiosis protein mei2 [Neolecta irregularis DAH-3]
MHTPPHTPMDFPLHLSKLARSSDEFFSSSFEQSRISSAFDYSLLQTPSSPPTRSNCSTPINDLSAIPASLFDSPSPVRNSAACSRPLLPRAQADFVTYASFSSSSPTRVAHDYSQPTEVSSRSFALGSTSIYSGSSVDTRGSNKPLAIFTDNVDRRGNTYTTNNSEHEPKSLKPMIQNISFAENDVQIEDSWIQVPSRFLKIANLPKTTEPWVLKEMFKGFGSLDDIYIRNLSFEGWVIVSFFDLRDAIKTNKQLRHQRFFNDRRLDSQFCSRNTVISLTRQEIYSENQGEVSVTAWTESIPSQDSVQMLLSSFGDIRFLSHAGPLSPNVFICEFFDLREASSAVDMLNGRSFNGTLFEVAYHEPDSITWKIVSQLLQMSIPDAKFHRLPTSEDAVPISASAIICPVPLTSSNEVPEQCFTRRGSTGSNFTESGSPADGFIRPGTAGSSFMLQGKNEVKIPREGRKSIFGTHLFPKLQIRTQDENFSPETYRSYSPGPLSAPPVYSKCFTDSCLDGSAVSKSRKPKSSCLTPTNLNLANIQKDSSRCSYSGPQTSFTVNAAHKVTHPPSILPEPRIVTLGNVPDNNKVDLNRITAGLDLRTTIMVKNVPNKYTQQMLLEYMDEVCERTYDFLYLRIDFKNKCNVGYAFVNFIESKSIIAFAEVRVGTKWNKFHSDKICDISYANIQGKDSLIEKFRNSSVMDEQLTYRPKIFKSAGCQIGEEEIFPEPNNVHHKLRSVANAQQIGLFPPLATRDLGRNKRTI